MTTAAIRIIKDLKLPRKILQRLWQQLQLSELHQDDAEEEVSEAASGAGASEADLVEALPEEVELQEAGKTHSFLKRMELF